MVARHRNNEAASGVPLFNMIDLFAGVGGLTLGFLDTECMPAARFKARLMVDNDPEARNVTIRNLPYVPYKLADITTLAGKEVRAMAGMDADETLHVLVGGPPCQGFSWLGRRALDDERNACLLEFIRIVKELKPLVALIENVPMIVTSHGGAIIREVCDGLATLGYTSCADILVASEYGVPQLRKRAFVLAYHRSLGLPPQFPQRSHERVPTATALATRERSRFELSKLPYISVEEAIGDLPQIPPGGGDDVMMYSAEPFSQFQRWARSGSIAVFNHKSRAHSASFIEKISVIGEGGRNQDLPDEKRFSDNYYSQAYARLHRNGLAQTVTTHFGNPGSGRFTHYSELRSLTVREAARLQSFPDRYVFDGHLHVQMRHVGNAVPPLLARVLRDQIAGDLLAAELHLKGRGRRRKVVRETPEQRSRVMRAVPSKDTSAERQLRRALSRAGIRGYRLHAKAVPGHPDLIFGRTKVAIFVDGCFWHGCRECYRAPKTNTDYWRMKVTRNRERDRRITEECREAGWTVVRLWEHEINNGADAAARMISRLLAKLERRQASSRNPVKAKTTKTTARRTGTKQPAPTPRKEGSPDRRSK